MRGRDTAQKNKNSKLADEYKDSCPQHRQKDLESLIQKLKGNKEKIKEQIELWWDEPVEAEEKWEDVSKKTSKKHYSRNHTNGSGNGGGNNDKSSKSSNGGGGGGGGYHGRGGRGGYRSGDRGGRGGHGRGMNGGRGGGGRHRDHHGRDRGGNNDRDKSDRFQKTPQQEKKENVIAGPGPVPVKPVRPLQGAWGQRAAAPVAVASSSSAPPQQTPPPPPPALVEVKPVVEPEPVFDVGVVTSQDPTPAGFVESNDVIQTTVAPPAPKPAAPTGNVWATRGSAHIIQAEKPKPPPQPVSKPTKSRNSRQQKQQQQQPSIVEQSLPTESAEPTVDSLPEPVKEDPIVTPPSTSTALESGLPASVNGANINAAGWKPMDNTTTSSVDIVQPSPVGPVSIASAPAVSDVPILDNTEPVKETIVPTKEPAPAQTIPTSIESLKPASALNMGHWETGDGEDNVSHDFGFGFGQENDVASVDDAAVNGTSSANVSSVPQPTPAAPKPTESVTAATTSTVSPARPPPGLGIGMPPMPDQIVHVHELENKLESASLAAKKEEVSEKVDISAATTKETSSSTQSDNAYATQPTSNEGFVQMPPAGIMSQQSYTGQYGMGMYSYNGQNPAVTAPNGFMGVPNPLLSSGVLPQQKQQNVNAQQQGVGLPQQGSIYGAPATTNPATESTTNTESSNPANPSQNNNAGIPPGIPGAMPFNPALFYGQQPYQMGQHHGVGAYGFAAAYGGQYGGVQGGFGYQQVMGQGGAYQPYDDQGHGNHSTTNNHQGGYNKTSGGYRGRNNHNNHHHNQYQNQYNPQSYGGQPYNMGYNDYNQRGGYGPGGHMDSSYMQNSGGYQSGFNQDDGQQVSKGKSKGGNRNFGSNPNMHQYQPSQQQQFGGLQGAGSGGVSDTTGNNGLNYQNWGGGL